MDPWLELIERTDYCSALVIILLLACIGLKMVAPYPAWQPWGMRLAAATFLAYGTHGLAKGNALTAEWLLEVTLRGLVAAGLMLGPAWMALAVLAFLYDWTIKPALDTAEAIHQQRCRDQEEAKRQKQLQEEAERRQRLQEDAERRERERPPPPPPPTRQERMTAAHERYETTLRLLEGAKLDAIELAAAREQAKRQYLRELSEVMQ